jgi:hypothetical protein
MGSHEETVCPTHFSRMEISMRELTFLHYPQPKLEELLLKLMEMEKEFCFWEHTSLLVSERGRG